MIKLEDILKLAESQIGYTEEPPGSNCTKYNRAYYGYNQPAAWCAIWCWWLCWTLGDEEAYCAGHRFACCDDVQDWAASHGILCDTPHIGDWVLFDWNNDNDADHIGIVVAIGNGYVETIEGNTDDKVMRKKRSECILGYVRTDFDKKPEEEDMLIYDKLPMIKYGSLGAAVVTWQGILGDVVPDGIFGSDTERSTIEHQKKWFPDQPEEHDGIVGPKTWRKGLYSLTD